MSGSRSPKGGSRRDQSGSPSPKGGSRPIHDTHVICGRQPVAEALRAGREIHRVLVTDRAGRELKELAARAREAGIQMEAVEPSVLDEAAQGVRHQGVVAVAPPFSYTALEALRDVRLVVVLDGVTDPQNLGAVARCAEAAAADAIVLPRRRSASVTPSAERAAAGAFSWLPVAQVPNTTRAIESLGDRGCWTVGLDGDAPDDLWSCNLLDGPLALVLGAEGRGLSRLVAERVDARIAIPMAGRLGSLNVAAAAAVALFEIVRRREQSAERG